jgi:molybdate transport system substrate-binding protein
MDLTSPGARFLIILFLLIPGFAAADEIRVATASNFRNTMAVLIREFESRSEHKVIPIYGSTGKLFAQIINGSPVDALFAADARRPELLDQAGLAVPGSRFTYATGQLVLWSPIADYVDASGTILEQGDFRHLAIANPALAPYGVAARQVLESLGAWEKLHSRLVQGENIGQTFLFVHSGNAELGFIARSQLLTGSSGRGGSSWQVPADLYQPIEQQAVMLDDSEAARAFMAFIRSSQAVRIIRNHGYSLLQHELPRHGLS